MTKVYLIRHAEAEGNLYRRVHGQYDSLITDNGYRQLAALAQRFADVPLDAVYSSDLFRAVTTARAVAEPKGLTVHTRPDLRELNMGSWEDRSFAGLDRSDKAMMRLFYASSPDFQAPGGESLWQVRQRGMAAVLEIAAKHPSQTVAVFAHGTFIRNTIAGFLNIPIEEVSKMGHSDNTAVACLEIQGDQVLVLYRDDNSHLPAELSTLGRQFWWRKDSQQRDINLWFRPMDPANPQDQSFYLDCRKEAWESLYGRLDRYDGSAFLQEAKLVCQRDPQSLVAAMDHDEPVGLLQLDLDRGSTPTTGYISFFYLVPALRRKGCGVQLIGKSVSIYRPLNRDRLELVCSEANGHALAFYEKYGFQITGQRDGAYGKLFTMEKYIGYGQPGAAQ
ncbi:MAG: GNAT family N-acetyltransferase [Ruminiclostridium sp.]|jgi:probable phosphoglycerate mutase|nr:GNAT family N-acetyltransferase [Ruminiclostridium sp.]